jgi:hypothetical protein
MSWATLDDGRAVLVNDARRTTRKVQGESVPVAQGYREVYLDDNWQVVKASRLKPLVVESAFGRQLKV